LSKRAVGEASFFIEESLSDIGFVFIAIIVAIEIILRHGISGLSSFVDVCEPFRAGG